MSETDLALRAGLPPHLRVLADRYTRDGWRAHSNFDSMTRYWLSRHAMFRTLTDRLLTDAEAFLDGERDVRQYRSRLASDGGTLIQELHMHHGVEDHHYFPQLIRKAPEVAAAFDILDADHHALDAQLAALTEAANAALRTASGDTVGPIHAVLTKTARFLHRHLSDEEEIVVPIILEHGGQDLA
ncbi:MAG: hemerythrin domain-containing protein [Pseudomonadota bacterium]